MSAKSIRATLAADPEVGAGNVLTTLAELDLGLDTPQLTFDTPAGDTPAWQPLTLRQLHKLVAARTAALHELGVRKRDPVAVIAPTAIDTALTFLALARIGAVPALINPSLAPDLAVKFVGRLDAFGLITDPEHAAFLPESATGVPVLSDDIAGLNGDPDAAPAPYLWYPTDPVAITHSSGTTGLPKAVVHSHQSLYAAIRYRLSLPRPQGTERMLSALPCPHAAGLIILNLGMSYGSDVAMLSQQTGPGVLAAIDDWKPRAVVGFSTTWPDLVKADLSRHDLSSVALWWNTGDCAHEAHIRRLVACGNRQTVTRAGRESVPGSVFVDGLGSSEMGHSHFFIAHTPETDRYNRCIGKVHSFAEAKVFGPEGNELPYGEVGELGTKSTTLSLGYWNDSASTYRTRYGGYFLTGDLVYRDEEGYFYHLDRRLDSVDLGNGKFIYTSASEERILAACPDVLDCTIVAVRDGDTVRTDVLLQLEADADPAVDRTAEVRAALEDHVAATLRHVIAVDDDKVPLTPTGKVRKFVLRQRHLEGALQ
ncbi:MAG TPA: class I adenylate-forming enzyme family protein [Streptosporangiaceae bacterium]|nr:class I adenylate-forming enzyme family protein [Streptosporangiaceae bacterium]